MPAKKHQLTDAERAKNIRRLAREVEASNDPAVVDGALRKIVQHRSDLGSGLIDYSQKVMAAAMQIADK